MSGDRDYSLLKLDLTGAVTIEVYQIWIEYPWLDPRMSAIHTI